MIKDVMVRLDGTSGDDARLAAASQIAQIFESHITGLFFNVVPDGFKGAAAITPPNRHFPCSSHTEYGRASCRSSHPAAKD